MPLEPLSRPSISVVIPTHNDVSHIGDALDSIVRQTFPPLEIIVSDDGSTDDTSEFVERFAAKSAVPVIYIRSGVHRGVVGARNEGIAASRGAWIATCDSDDYWAPSKLEQQIAFLNAWVGSPISLLGTHGLNVNDKRRIVSSAVIGPVSEAEYQRLRQDSGVFFVIHSSVIFARSDCVRAGGYTEDYGAAEDLAFFTQLGRLGVVIVVPQCLTYYRKRAGSVQQARFWDLRYQVDRLGRNERRRLRGDPPLDHETFMRLHTYQEVPRWRNGYWRYGWSKYHYRRGSVQFVNGQRLRGGVHLGLGVVLGQDFGRTRKAATSAVRQFLRRTQGPRP